MTKPQGTYHDTATAARVFAALLTLGLLLTGCTHGSGTGDRSMRSAPTAASDKTAVKQLEAARGGTVTNADGVSLTVPPGVMKSDGVASITPLPNGSYDVHLAAAWKGHVRVSFPDPGGPTYLMHKRATGWVFEAAIRVEDRLVASVDSLSIFDIARCLKEFRGSKGSALKVLLCLRKDGIKKIPTQLGKKLVAAMLEYDACESLSSTNFTVDAVDALLAFWERLKDGCSAVARQDTGPGQGGSTLPVGNADGSDLGQPYNPQSGATGGSTGGSSSGSTGGTTGASSSGSTSGASSGTVAPGSGRITLAQGGGAPSGYWYNATLSGWNPGAKVTVSCHDSKSTTFYSQAIAIDGNGNGGDSTLCFSGDGPDHWVTGAGTSSNHLSWGGTAPPPPPPAPTNPKLSLAQGGTAQHGYWYNATLSGFSPGSQVSVTCRDSADPGGFYSQNIAIDGNGNGGDSTLCYSGDGPDHWVTGGGLESNHVTWGGSAPPPPAASPKISLSQGGSAQYGYWYAVNLSGFSPGSQVSVTCRDSVDPGGFYSQNIAIDGNGNGGDSTLCYSGDHPDHWVTGGGVESNHVSW